MKRSGRDEPMWVAIHTCMEAKLGISLHSCIDLKLGKMLFFLLSLMFALQQNQRKRGWYRFCLKVVRGKGEVAQTMYTHVKNYIYKEVMLYC
jgi:hypothetical protein